MVPAPRKPIPETTCAAMREGIEHHVTAENVGEAVGGDDDHKATADAHQHVRAQPRRPLQPLSFVTDDASRDRGGQQSDQGLGGADHRLRSFRDLVSGSVRISARPERWSSTSA